MSLAEAKLHLRAASDDQDAMIAGYITAARMMLDGRDGALGRSLVTQTWDYKLDAFPAPGASLDLPLSPVASVTSVTYRDSDGASQTWSASQYVLKGAGGGSAYIVEADGYSWPGTDGTAECVTVRFVAGYGGRQAVPEPIRQAMLLLVEDFYDRPESSYLRDRSKSLWLPYRVSWL